MICSLSVIAEISSEVDLHCELWETAETLVLVINDGVMIIGVGMGVVLLCWAMFAASYCDFDVPLLVLLLVILFDILVFAIFLLSIFLSVFSFILLFITIALFFFIYTTNFTFRALPFFILKQILSPLHHKHTTVQIRTDRMIAFIAEHGRTFKFHSHMNILHTKFTVIMLQLILYHFLHDCRMGH